MADADAHILEQLHRIEHKLDLLVRAKGAEDKFFATMAVQSMGQQQFCPLCGQLVQYLADLQTKVIFRKCGCSSGKLAPLDLSQFAPPNQQRRSDEQQQSGGHGQEGGSGGSGGGSGL